jgi:N-acetylated-alpha-linked acidic dipeptidase
MAQTPETKRAVKRIAPLFLLFAALIPASIALGEPQEAAMPGYTAKGAKQQRELEERFRALPSAENIRKYHRYFTAEPHPAASARNNELGDYIAEEWKKQGWEDVRIHRYDVLDSRPREVIVEMLSPVPYRASLREDAYDVDPDTKNPAVSSAYSGFSASGEVTAPLVYAHSGNPADYELLKSKGIDVRGKIVIVRYSLPYSYRGFKALTAERMGAAAILIYSDPAEDGFKKGKVYPDGPWGPESHIQRGAITYDFIVPGDPLTPGWASLPDAKRIPVEKAASVPKIIAVPLSWRDAKPLLENLDGPEAPKSWQGGLPIKYRLGGSRVKVHVKADMDNAVRPYYVVEARIRGSEFPDELVILGNHRDAWVFGGVDPSSGTASMMELTRALGLLKQQGIRPRRTLVVCSWDGEEVGLTGSTEWGEHFEGVLRENAVAYLNVDSSASGPNFQGSAVASLAPMLVDISRTLPAPSGKTLYDEWRASRQKELGAKQAVGDDKLVDTRIGSGSDHTVFLNYLGIPTVGLQFDGPYGVYHSMYDNHYWISQIGDPGFRYHTLMTQLWGALALRLANADVVPFDFAMYAEHIEQFVDELDRNTRLGRFIELGALRRRIAELREAGAELNTARANALAAGSLDPKTEARTNAMLRQVERNWLHAEGIPGRPWFKHTLYAARFTYAHLELPGLTEAAEAKDWPLAREQAAILERAVAQNAKLLREIRAELKPASP